MEHKNILLTGASGELGKAIASSCIFPSLLAPSREIMDITKQHTIRKFFDNNDFDAVIHCAAMARMRECEENPTKAVETNIIGTGNLVNAIINKEGELGNKIRFVHISTDGVYPGIKGDYSEKDETRPYTAYGWTKLGAECAVNALSDFCIVRASFFDPGNIKFEDAATDAYSSKAPINYLVKAISLLVDNDFAGTINVGRERRSDYEHYKEFKPNIKKCKLEDIRKKVNFNMYEDSSMDISLWKKIEKNYGTNKK